VPREIFLPSGGETADPIAHSSCARRIKFIVPREIFLPSGGEKTGGGESPFKKPWKTNSDNEIKVTTLNQDLT